MPKHPTPKRRLSKDRTRRRYAAFQSKTRKRLQNSVNLVDCSSCGEKRQTHTVCNNCGFYRGRQVVDKTKTTKKAVQKIKA